MIRLMVIALLSFALPWLVALALALHRAVRGGDLRIVTVNTRRLTMLGCLCAALVLGLAAALLTTRISGVPGDVYVAPRFENGTVVPAQFIKGD